MTIHTTTSLRTRNRRVDRKLARAQTVLERMEGGASLYLEFAKGSRRWSLSTGEQVEDAAGELVASSSSVICCGGSLFGDCCLGQVWRWWRTEENV
jgi:hypothetical protein